MRSKIFRAIAPLPDGKKDTLVFPPISLGIIYRYLRDHGFPIEQEDVHALWHHAHSRKDNERLQRLASDEQRLWAYLGGGTDTDWEWFCRGAMRLSDFRSADILLLSLISSQPEGCQAGLAFAHFLKQHLGKPIVLGGEYFAHAPISYVLDRVLHLGVIDYYIAGYGEEALGQLLRILSGAQCGQTLSTVPGLSYLGADGVHRNPPVYQHPVVPPDFEGLPVDLYRWEADCLPPDASLPEPASGLVLPFHTSTGCPHRCAFCDCSGVRDLSTLPPVQVVAELQRLVTRYGCCSVFFADNTLNTSRHRINDLCDHILEAGLDVQWTACGSVAGMDADTVRKMRAAGAVRIIWGLESGSNRLLGTVKKPFQIEEASRVIALAHEAGIWNGVEVIVGLPTETEAEFEETLRFLANSVEIIDEVWPYQFYLNSVSDMCQRPSAYGIANLRPVNRGLTKEAVWGSCAASYIFDEVDSWRWPEKEEQLRHRLSVMLEHIAPMGLYPMGWEHEQQVSLLSWCYRQRSSKSEVRQLYHTYWEKLALCKWRGEGWQAESVDELADELLPEFTRCGSSSPNFESVWHRICPGDCACSYPGMEYKQALLFDGRFHDRLVYDKLRRMCTG